jgi:hypothetical protein
MAPSNLSQVFIANDISDPTNGTIETGSTFYTTAAAAANTLIGVWDMSANSFAGGYATTAINALKGPIQIVQTPLAGKNTIASPLFEAKDIKYIKYTPYAVSVKHKVNVDVGTLSGTSGDDAIIFRFALRTAPTDYLSFSSPNDTSLDLSNGGYTFPLVGNFSAGRMIFNVEISETDHANTEATLYTKVAAAIAANKTLNAIFSVTNNTTSIDFEARHVGVIFDVTVQYSSGTALNETQVVTGWDAGSGNYWQALGDEKKMRSKYGNFNRMYFPQDFTQYAVSGNTYDVVEVGYVHNHPQSTGIARAAEMNIVKMYHKVAAGTATIADTLFGGFTVGAETYFTY